VHVEIASFLLFFHDDLSFTAVSIICSNHGLDLLLIFVLKHRHQSFLGYELGLEKNVVFSTEKFRQLVAIMLSSAIAL
jgi:hypothetical protein